MMLLSHVPEDPSLSHVPCNAEKNNNEYEVKFDNEECSPTLIHN